MNDINPIQQNLEYFYLKKGTYNDEIPLLVMNKFISYNNPQIASDIDKNFFLVDEEINKARLFLNLPQSKVPYIQYFKKIEQEDEFEFLFVKMRKFLKVSKREFKHYKQIVLDKLKDKEKMREYFKYFGIEKSKYKDFDLEFSTKNKIKSLGDY